jgi:hypothetical protein
VYHFCVNIFFRLRLCLLHWSFVFCLSLVFCVCPVICLCLEDNEKDIDLGKDRVKVKERDEETETKSDERNLEKYLSLVLSWCCLSLSCLLLSCLVLCFLVLVSCVVRVYVCLCLILFFSYPILSFFA